jgi:hypothetical protein
MAKALETQRNGVSEGIAEHISVYSSVNIYHAMSSSRPSHHSDVANKALPPFNPTVTQLFTF